jgi:hypothetical protein
MYVCADPFKDTSGPSLNILIKLMSIFSLVLTPLFGSDWQSGYWWVEMIVLGCEVGILWVVYYFVWQREGKAELPDPELSKKEVQA